MTSELAKKLSEAGFPSVTRWEIENNSRRAVLVQGESLPPLACLMIEATKLSDDFINLSTSAIDQWFAYTSDGQGDQYYGILNAETGSTPEEAMSKLWLALKVTSISVI